MTNFDDIIKDYTDRGFYLTKVSDCSPGKPCRCKGCGEKPHPCGRWWNKRENNDHIKIGNIGIVCGRKSGIFVLDIDPRKEGEDCEDGVAKWNELIKKYGKIKTLMQKSPRGTHYFFKYEDRLEGIKGTKIPLDGIKYSIDIRTDGNAVNCYPTCRCDGRYKWVNKNKNKKTEIVTIPDWLYDMLPKPSEKKPKKPKEIKPKEKKKPKSVINKETSDEALNKFRHEKRLLIDLCNMLSDERIDSYDDWIKLGSVLKSMNENNLDVWKHASRRSSKYDENVCEEKWSTFDNNKSTIGTLRMWAKEDSPEKYRKYYLTYKYVFRALTKTSFNVSEAIKSYFGNCFICTNYKAKDGWYMFKEHHWIKCQDNEIINRIVKDYSYFVSKMIHQQKDPKVAELMNELYLLLRDISYIEKIVKSLRTEYYNSEFEKKINTKDLIVFTNGVYDLIKLEFRDGRPEDFMSFTTGCRYNTTLSYDDKNVKRIIECTKQIIPDEDEYQYFTRSTGYSCLFGNSREKYTIMNGKGRNGKGVWVKIITTGLGEYTGVLSSSYITSKKKNSSNATPEMEILKGKRFVFITEPEADEKFNVYIIKELSGNDQLVGRALFKDASPYDISFYLYIQCNDIPAYSDVGTAIEERSEIINFKSHFSYNPNENDKYSHKRDDSLKSFISTHPEECAWLIIEWLKDYTHNGIQIPESVIKHTDEVMIDNNMYKAFVEDYLEQTNDECFVELKDLHQLYKSNVDSTEIKFQNFKKHMIKHVNVITDQRKIKGKNYRNIIMGYKIIDNNDTDSESD